MITPSANWNTAAANQPRAPLYIIAINGIPFFWSNCKLILCTSPTQNVSQFGFVQGQAG